MRKQEHQDHGGNWKVAYADFVTAMMAFFMVMWLTSTATPEQKKQIARYFSIGIFQSDRTPGMGKGAKISTTDHSTSSQQRAEGVMESDTGAAQNEENEAEDELDLAPPSGDGAHEPESDARQKAAFADDPYHKAQEKPEHGGGKDFRDDAAKKSAKASRDNAARDANNESVDGAANHAHAESDNLRYASAKEAKDIKDKKAIAPTPPEQASPVFVQGEITAVPAGGKVTVRVASEQAGVREHAAPGAVQGREPLPKPAADPDPVIVKTAESVLKPVPEKAEAQASAVKAQEVSRTDRVAAETMQAAAKEAMQAVAQELKSLLAQAQGLEAVRHNITVSVSDDGVKIDIADDRKRSMFKRGSRGLTQKARKILKTVAAYLTRVTGQLVITGHTDATGYRHPEQYSNWDLSADRANAARRCLESYGVASSRFDEVAGKGDSRPAIPDNPKADANRRVTLTLLMPKAKAAGVARGRVPSA